MACRALFAERLSEAFVAVAVAVLVAVPIAAARFLSFADWAAQARSAKLFTTNHLSRSQLQSSEKRLSVEHSNELSVERFACMNRSSRA